MFTYPISTAMCNEAGHGAGWDIAVHKITGKNWFSVACMMTAFLLPLLLRTRTLPICILAKRGARGNLAWTFDVSVTLLNLVDDASMTLVDKEREQAASPTRFSSVTETSHVNAKRQIV